MVSSPLWTFKKQRLCTPELYPTKTESFFLQIQHVHHLLSLAAITKYRTPSSLENRGWRSKTKVLVSQKSPLLSLWGTLPSGDSMSAQTFYCYKNISQIVLGVPGVDWGISTCHQREDESSNLQNPHKLRRQRQGIPKTSWLVRWWVLDSVGCPSSINKVESGGGRHPVSTSVLSKPYMCIHMYTYAHQHT